jgi:hypothetical protein
MDAAPRRNEPEPKIFQPQQPPMEVRKPLFNPAPAQPVQPIQQQPPVQQPMPRQQPQPQAMPESSDEDELDIPAFIRKKMK